MTDQESRLTFGFGRPALLAAFEAVEDSSDWRAPIKAQVPVETLDVTLAAIKFFTATQPSAGFPVAGLVLVQSEGYRNGPAGP